MLHSICKKNDKVMSMVLNSLVCNQIVKKQPGKRNIPKYLYHFTTQNKYQQIVKSGYIQAFRDENIRSDFCGVFMVDLRNFTKRWMTKGIECGDKLLTFSKALIMQTSKDNSNLVVLRIPTMKLNLNKLRCRSIVSENLDHIKNCDFATNQRHYTRKKEPIEYIIGENISIKDVVKIGESYTGFNLEEAIRSVPTNYIDRIDDKSILKNLFKKTPEEKCINIVTKKLG